MHARKEVQFIDKKLERTNLPAFRSGDTVRVHARIKEGGKERIQYIEGVVIKKAGSGAGKTFTLRKISDGGIGVELIYPLASNNVANIEILSHGDVRRAKLYYLRGLTGKAARVKSKDKVGTKSEASVAGAKPGSSHEPRTEKPKEKKVKAAKAK